MFSSSGESKKLIEAIRDQTDGVAPYNVYVLDIVSVRFGGFITPEIKAEIQKFNNLQMLTLNDCGIKSLDNFPHIPGLIRLDLVFNQITGESLHNIKGSRHLQTLMLGANKIQKFEHIEPLRGMKQLLQIDLINNPISREPGYRQKIFTLFPSVNILDTLDKGGKDAYTNPSMIQAASRVPDSLFDKSPSVPVPAFSSGPIFGGPAPVLFPPAPMPVTKSKRAVSKSAVSALITKKNRGKGGKAKSVSSKSTTSTRAGIIFPSARIKRKYKESVPTVRVSKTASIYTAAVLEYMAAELLEIAGNEAKREKKQRITPQIMKKSLMQDEELYKFLNSVTFGMNE